MLLSASRILGRVFGLGLALFVLWATLITRLHGSIPVEGPITILLAIVVCVVLHELLHMASALCVGAQRVSIGAWKKGRLLLGFYVKIDAELPVSRWLVVALTPLLLLSPACMLLAPVAGNLRGFLTWLSIVNTVGSAGDIALAILAAGSGLRATVRDVGEAIEVRGGSPSCGYWALLNALAVFGYALFCYFIALQALFVVAMVRGEAIELHGVKLVEVVREESSVAATATASLLAIFLLSGLTAAAVAAIYSLARGQPNYTSAAPTNS